MYLDERKHLLPLPEGAYRMATHERALLSRDCHLQCRKNYYSAPHGLRGKKLSVWISDKTVEIYDGAGNRVALHARSRTHGKYITDEKHYPPECQAYLDADIVKMKSWAEDIGPSTKQLVHELLSGPYPLQFLRRSQGILNLSRRYSREALEKAALTANLFNQKTIHYLERVILQQRGPVSREPAIERGANPNLRGLARILH